MIRTEQFEKGGKSFTKTRSDDGRLVVGGEPHGEYSEAIDPTELGRTYTEGEYFEDPDPEEALSILLGGVEA